MLERLVERWEVRAEMEGWWIWQVVVESEHRWVSNRGCRGSPPVEMVVAGLWVANVLDMDAAFLPPANLHLLVGRRKSP